MGVNMENIEKHSKGLNGSTLKIIAIVAMLIDHIGATIVENMMYSYAGNEQTIIGAYFIMRTIGRLSFPIFCFLLVEGFFHTKDIKKYVFRLFLFALISEVPFDYAFNQSFLEFTSQNVFFTLFLGVLMLWAIEHIKTRFNGKNAVLIISIALVVVVASLLADFIKCDYSSLGIIVILLMYTFKNNKLLKAVSVSFAFAFLTNFGLQTLAALAFIPISFYNGKKGLSLKYFFYAFYPVHLLLLGIIVRFIM
jgi:hypothetical protein